MNNQVDEKRIVTSTGALSFEKVPEKLIIIGGGIIGLELVRQPSSLLISILMYMQGSVWSRLGAKVTVVEYLDSIGAGMDSATAAAFYKILVKQGIQFKLGTKVISGAYVDATNQCDLEVEPAKGGPREKARSMFQLFIHN